MKGYNLLLLLRRKQEECVSLSSATNIFSTSHLSFIFNDWCYEDGFCHYTDWRPSGPELKKKLIFHTLLRKTLLPFAALWTTSKTQQVSKWENAGDWTQQSFVAYCKSCISEEKPPGQFLLKRHLQPIEACTSTSPFVTLPFIIFFLARRSFSFHDTTYGFLLLLDFIWQFCPLSRQQLKS